MKHYINNTANTAIMWQSQVAKKELSTQELASINASIESNSFSIKTNRAQDYNTYFKFDNENIGVKLNEASIEKLKEFFDSDNFIETSKGIILDKDAASYVAGWFSDIAYKQKFLEADSNNNGELTHKEARITLGGFREDAVLITDEKTKEKYIISNAITKTYEESSFLPKNDAYYSDISSSINDAIKDDKNLDGIITFAEFMDVGEKGYFEDFLEISNNKNNEDFINLYKLTNTDKLKEKELKELKKQAALAKLKNQGLENLTSDEKKLLKDFAINLKISEEKLNDLISSDKLKDFMSYTKDFVKELSETKLLDIKA